MLINPTPCNNNNNNLKQVLRSNTFHLKDILDSASLSQFVTEKTHKLGHTIDVVVSRSDDNLIDKMFVTSMISDHYIIQSVLRADR